MQQQCRWNRVGASLVGGRARGLGLVALIGVWAGPVACQTAPDDGDDGAGSESSSEDDSEGTPGSGSLYPLVPGATWTYLDSYSQTGAQAEVVTIQAADPAQWGPDAFLLSDSPDEAGEWTESVIQRDGTAARRIHKTVRIGETPTLLVEYDPGFMRADDAWIDLPVGSSFELSYLRTASDKPGEPETRVHSFTIAAKNELVEVPAGSFDCIKIVRERKSGASAGEIVELWYAPRVGKVKEVRPHEGRFEVLSDWSIPGQD